MSPPPNTPISDKSLFPLSAPRTIPLCVDLDGTLIYEDTTRLAAMTYAGLNPFKWVQIGWWFLKGRHAYMKLELAKRVTLHPRQWTFIQGTLDLLAAAYEEKRPIYLISATAQKFANAVANDPRIKHYFPEQHVIGTSGSINLRRQAKADCLVHLLGEKQFIYAGNSMDDIYVWNHGVQPVVVVPHLTDALLKKVRQKHPHPYVILC